MLALVYSDSMDFGILKRPIRFQAIRLKIALKDISHLLVTENRVRIPILLGFILFCLLLVLELWPVDGFTTAIVRTTLSLAEIGLAVFVSLELFKNGLRPHAKERIDRPENVVEFYEDRGCTAEFIQLPSLPGWIDSSSLPDRAPGIVESVPESPLRTKELQVDIEGQYFPLPDRVQRLYEPVIKDIQEQFVEEDNFNQIKLRPLSYVDDEFRMGTTTFFNNFATNLSPDYQLFTHRTPRELLHPLVFRNDGNIRSLSETDLPYIAASAGIVIDRSGKAIFPIRSRDLVIEGMNLGLSFGGSWDKDVVESEGVHGQILRELAEEREIHREEDIVLYYLGTLRRLELMGKPDCFLVALTDTALSKDVVSREESDAVVIDLVPEDVTVDSINTLLNHVETVNERVSRLLIDSSYPPSPGLLYWLYLLNLAASEDTGR